MEDGQHHKPKRTNHSVLDDVPAERHDHHHKRGLLMMGVVMSMIVILGLYAASFRYTDFVPVSEDDVSRWSAFQEEFLDDSKSVLEGFGDITQTVSGVLNAGKVRNRSIDLMKGKIAGVATSTDPTDSATGTPEDAPPDTTNEEPTAGN